VRVEIGDTDCGNEWNHVDERSLDFAPRRSYVVRFDKSSGFAWR
jgi:hypothetical protein